MQPTHDKADLLGKQVIGAAIGRSSRGFPPGRRQGRRKQAPDSQGPAHDHVNLLNIPAGLIIRFYETIFKSDIHRLIFPSA
jgi:hypothetical protein